nr:MAG TPA: hypothetical protein [Caudoviricetes sp.]
MYTSYFSLVILSETISTVSISLSFAIFSPAFRYFIALHDLKCYD